MYVRESHLKAVRAFYPEVDKGIAYEVTLVEQYAKLRRRIYVAVPGREGPAVLWPVQVRALPRCELCDQEGHTRSSATRANCERAAKAAA